MHDLTMSSKASFTAVTPSTKTSGMMVVAALTDDTDGMAGTTSGIS